MKKFAIVFFSMTMVFLFSAQQGFTSQASQDPKKFVVGPAGPNASISQDVKSSLLKAYKAQYGPNAGVDRIEYVKYNNKTFLAFQSNGKGSPTFAIQLEAVNGKWTFDRNSVTNTCTGNPCSWCYFSSSKGCVCNAEGSCNHTTSSLKDLGSKILETLSI